MREGGASTANEKIVELFCHCTFQWYFIRKFKLPCQAVFAVNIHRMVGNCHRSTDFWLSQDACAQILLLQYVFSLQAVAFADACAKDVLQGVAVKASFSLQIMPIPIDSCPADSIGAVAVGKKFLSPQRGKHVHVYVAVRVLNHCGDHVDRGPIPETKAMEMRQEYRCSTL